MKFLPYKEWLQKPENDSIVFFDSEVEVLNAQFTQDTFPFGALVSDENLRATIQNKFWWIDFQIGEEASLLDSNDFEVSNYENDLTLVINQRNAEDMYRVASKATQIKCDIWCEDEEIFNFYKKKNYTLVSLGTPAKINSKIILAFPEYDRIAPKYIGSALCQDVSLLTVSSHMFVGYRTQSYWDNLLDFSVGELQDYYHLIEHLVTWAVPNSRRLFNPRKYYVNYLGKNNILKRFGYE